jgi:colicin import membrane protein
MIAESAMGDMERLDGSRWGLMLVVSVVLHLAVLSAAIFLSGAFQSKEIEDIVYEVDLVSLPSSAPQQQTVAASNPESIVQKSEPVKKAVAVEEKKIPIPVEKTPAKKPAVKKEETSATNVDAAIARLQKKVKAEGSEQLDQAISNLEKKNKSEEGHLSGALARLQSKTGGASSKESASGTGVIGSLAMRIYQENVKSYVQNNWTYPTALQNKKDLEVILLLKVREDGTILETKVIQKSKDSVFDQSVLKAIERSNPIPPFPEGYEKSYEEFKFRFTLKDLLEK